MHGVAVQHAALAQCEVGDVDHLLHFAVAFRLGLAHFQRDQRTQCVLVLAQCFAAQAYGFTAARGRRGAPHLVGFLRTGDHDFVIRLGRGLDFCDHFAGGRVLRLEDARAGGGRPLSVTQIRASVGGIQSQSLEQLRRHANSCFLTLFWRRRGWSGGDGVSAT
ncbi:hypothetical protein D3C71_1102620 [compost metagenome]